MDDETSRTNMDFSPVDFPQNRSEEKQNVLQPQKEPNTLRHGNLSYYYEFHLNNIYLSLISDSVLSALYIFTCLILKATLIMMMMI